MTTNAREPFAQIGPLTAAEVSRYLGTHPNTVKRIPPQELPFFRVGARGDRRYDLDEVLNYISRRRVA